MKGMSLKSLITLVLALTLTISLAAPLSVLAADGDPVKITIVHTNDVHSRVFGEAYVAALANGKKAAGENVLTLCAGDVLHGQPIATLSRGLNIVSIMNAVGYDAMVPGNHDFNYGAGRLIALASVMDFPLVTANVAHKNPAVSTFSPYIIKEFDGVKVGIFGLTTPETATKTNPKNVEDYTFEFPLNAARKTVAKLKAQDCDVIIALTHLGIDEATWPEDRSTALAAIDGLDVVIDGHSHTTLPEGLLEDGLLIAQTGAHSENIGVVEITVSGGKVTDKTASLVAIPTEETPDFVPDAKVLSLIAALEKQSGEITSQVVGSTPVELQGEREFARKEEVNLGDLIADAMLYATGADIAITNGGGIRASLPVGDITMGDVLTVLPFSNYIVEKSMKGSDILAMLEHGVDSYPELVGKFPQVAGINFTFNANAEPGKRVTKVMLSDGKELEENRTYRVATNDFMAAGGDGYTMIGDAGGMISYSALDEALIAYLQTNPVIKAVPDGRIIVENKQAAAA